MTVARVALPVAAWQPFDYWVPQGARVSPGAVVKVRLAGRRLPGVVVDTRDESEVERAKLLAVDEVEALPALPDDVRELCRFVSSYYHVPPGLALALALPPLAAAATARREHAQPLVLTDEGRAALPPRITRAPVARALYERLLQVPEGLAPAEVAALSPTGKRTLARWRESGFVREASVRCAEAVSATLNGEQASAADAIVGALGAFSAFLLQGITGSGKTEVYIAAARACIEVGGQALLLVPEINLTPQLTSRVADALPRARTVTLHSALPDGARRANWEAAARGEADIVLGTRLAVFAPLPRLALVVVDEEHDTSFKQHDGVRDHARDAAVWRARRRGVPVVLGSATPSLESYAH
ncbi:MAG: DEAD/DEAH box helicase, partial [Burkholderiales bacterium]|nr:DEAD/DEAH box helicase [Burkholderiales bacterium]